MHPVKRQTSYLRWYIHITRTTPARYFGRGSAARICCICLDF